MEFNTGIVYVVIIGKHNLTFFKMKKCQLLVFKGRQVDEIFRDYLQLLVKGTSGSVF